MTLARPFFRHPATRDGGPWRRRGTVAYHAPAMHPATQALLFAATIVAFALLAVPPLARAGAAGARRLGWARVGRTAARALALTTLSTRTRAWVRVGLAPFGTSAAAAGRAAERALARLTAPDVGMMTMAVNAFIFAGRYRDALAVETAWDDDTRNTLAADPSWCIFQINLAEADYNLGDWDRAAARLLAIEADARAGDPLTRAAFAMQSAWIAAHTGGPDALAIAATCNESDLGPDYRSEYHFVHAAAHLSVGAFANARAHALRGLAVRRRHSSERNSHLLLGRIAAAAGDPAAACAHFARGATRRYRGQGGPELLLYGELLAVAGDEAAARRVFAWAAERDPESPAADVARTRLAPLRALP